MIIECQKCNKKFEISDNLIPPEGRLVQCGFCDAKWHQKPIKSEDTEIKEKKEPDFKLLDNGVEKPKKKIIDKPNNSEKDILSETKKISFFNYLFIFLISFIGLFLIVDTFKYQITNYIPNLETYIIYVYETLDNIFIIFKDLFKSY